MLSKLIYDKIFINLYKKCQILPQVHEAKGSNVWRITMIQQTIHLQINHNFSLHTGSCTHINYTTVSA
jgi:hypothetical protein